MLEHFIIGALGFITGGGLIAYFKFFKEAKHDDQTFAQEELSRYKEQVNNLNNAVSALSARLIPTNTIMWIKSSDGYYIDISPQYELNILNRLGLFKQNVIGKTDKEIFKSYPDFIEVMESIDKEASINNGVCIRHDVLFPMHVNAKMIIKEITTQDALGSVIYVGRAYDETC